MQKDYKESQIYKKTIQKTSLMIIFIGFFYIKKLIKWKIKN